MYTLHSPQTNTQTKKQKKEKKRRRRPNKKDTQQLFKKKVEKGVIQNILAKGSAALAGFAT